MRIPRRIAALYFLTSFLMGAGASFLAYFNNSASYLHQKQDLVIGLAFVLVSIIVSGIFLYYQQSLKYAKNNLDEAQKLAALGSWERDLVTGKGYWSENHYRLFGLQPRKTAPSMDEFFALIHYEDRESAFETVTSAINSVSSYEIEYRLAEDVHNRVFLSRGKIVSDDSGEPSFIVGTVQDITDKHRQGEFREELLRQKDAFITRLGHDLKTPLTPLVALMPLVLSRAGDDKQRELLDICFRNINHIKDLVLKTIQLARLSSPVRPQLNLVDIALSPAVDLLLEKMGEIIEERGIKLENAIESDMHVMADLQELENLFFNLVSNSAKFSAPASAVSISAAVEDAFVIITVRDNGIGLLPGELKHIFDEFYKADKSRSELGSSGLGLSICRMIVNNHGGRIWAESGGRDCGTAIFFTLPTRGVA